MLRTFNSQFSKTKSKFFFVPAIALAALMLSAASAWAEELFYDDGSVSMYTGGMEGLTLSVRFTVADPVTVTGVKFWHGTNPDGYDIRIHIWDQNQQEVYFYDHHGDAPSPGWAVVDLSSEPIPALTADFFVGIERTGSGVSIGYDDSDPDGRSYFGWPGYYFYELYDDKDYMIRAFVEATTQSQEVSIDIKFCSDPNAFNCKKKGVLPVTIFGTDVFDVTDIDISTLQLCTEDLSACTGAPIDYSIADRGDPSSDLGAAQCELIQDPPESGIWVEQDYLTQDGLLDLDVAFDASEVQSMLGIFCNGPKNAASEALVIIGSTLGGTTIHSDPIGDVGNVGTDQLWKVNK